MDLALVGFSDSELEALLADNEAPPPDVQDDVPEPPAQPVTRPGDVWLIGSHRLICGDCRDFAVVERLMAGVRANVCITSPPYATQREYDSIERLQTDPSGRVRRLVSGCGREHRGGPGG